MPDNLTHYQDRLYFVGQPCVLLDNSLKISAINSACRALFGKTEDDSVIGQPFSSLLPDHFLAQRLLHKCLHTAEPNRFEDFDSELNRWLEFRISNIDGFLSVVVEDIGDRKAEEYRRHSDETHWRDMLEGSGAGFVHIGLDGRWEYVNPRACEILGEPSSALLGLSLREFCSNHDNLNDQTNFAKLIAGSISQFVAERVISRRQGEDIWVRLNVSVVRTETGNPKFFVAIIDNIDDRKEAEESLKFALDAAHLSQWDYDAIRNETRRSPKFHEIFGYDDPPTHWGFEDFEKHIHPADRAAFASQFCNSIFNSQDYSFETRIVPVDETQEKWISLQGRVYLNRKGQTVRMAGLISDITAEKVAAREIHHARLAAEDANREKSYFLANMSHEIRTPLGAILGFTEALRDPHLSLPERERYLQILTRNGKALAELIGDILDLSKVEAGFLEVESAQLHAAEMVAEVVSLLQFQAEAKKIAIHAEFEPGLPATIISDPIRLRQILLNIIGNAIKFTKAGDVKIIVKKFGVSDTKNPQIAFYICDTGVGISPEAARRLFNPFTQADSSTTRKFGGTGLGLALSRRLARALGGDLVLETTKLDEGSVFRITIPAILPAPEILDLVTSNKIAAESASRHESFEGLRVLLAEDSLDNQELIKRILDKRGINTELADDGVEAVEMALHHTYDLVLMDMQMPHLDGYSATRELRKAGFLGPIVALTANAMRNDREKCLAAGCSDYLSKPIDPNKLFQIMGNAIAGSHH